MEEHVEEIRIKADPTIRMETKGGFSNQQVRIWFEKESSRNYDHGPLNPILDLNLRTVKHVDLEKLRTWFYQEIQKPGFPNGTETVCVFDIHNRKTLQSAWKYYADDVGRHGVMAKFFETVRLRPEIKLSFSFEDGAGPWLVTCRPKPNFTWNDIKERLAEDARAIPLEKRYSLSADAQALLRWILELRPDDFLAGMTPVVEERLGVEIGFKTDWIDQNTRIYLELLVEEINEKTEFKLRTLDWWGYPREATRILVKRKETDIHEVIRSIQVLGLKQNKLLSAEKVKAALIGLLAEN